MDARYSTSDTAAAPQSREDPHAGTPHRFNFALSLPPPRVVTPPERCLGGDIHATCIGVDEVRMPLTSMTRIRRRFSDLQKPSGVCTARLTAPGPDKTLQLSRVNFRCERLDGVVLFAGLEARQRLARSQAGGSVFRFCIPWREPHEAISRRVLVMSRLRCRR